jgi:hypothetical protein
MPFLEAHGVGKRDRGVELIPDNYATPIKVTGNLASNKIAIAKSVVFANGNEGTFVSIDIATGKQIANTSDNKNLNLNFMLADEHDDIIYGYIYNGSSHRVRAYDKNFKMVWECTDASSFSQSVGLLSKDYIFMIAHRWIYKISRTTGVVVSKKEYSDLSTYDGHVLGSNENKTKIAYIHTNGRFFVIDAHTLSVIKQGILKNVNDRDGYADDYEHPYGVGILKDVLHVFIYSTNAQRMKHLAFDLNDVIFDANVNALLKYELADYGNDYYKMQKVQTFKNCLAISTENMVELIQYEKNKSLKTSTIKFPLYSGTYSHINAKHYVGRYRNGELSEYGKVKL